MKTPERILGFLSIFFLVCASSSASASAGQCTTIKNGILLYSAGHYFAGEPIKTGFDDFGYNYQAHIFNSYYANAYLGREGFPPYEGDDGAYLAALPEPQKTAVQSKWYWPYRKDVVLMKWNDAWLSNMDCDGDGLLDRHYGSVSYIGSGAWETNHQSGSYFIDGKEFRWTYFCKIIAVPADAVKTAGIWYTAEGKEIGPDIWGEFAIIEEVYNDQGAGMHGVFYKSPTKAGLGNW